MALNRKPIRATERHLPYGITQCYLPPDTGERNVVCVRRSFLSEIFLGQTQLSG